MGNIIQETDIKVQRKLAEYLELRGWFVKRLLSTAYHDGIPVMYCHHRRHGFRWIEPKRPDDCTLTKLQWQKFSEWDNVNLPIYILTAPTQEQYDLLFGPPNWRELAGPPPPGIDLRAGGDVDPGAHDSILQQGQNPPA